MIGWIIFGAIVVLMVVGTVGMVALGRAAGRADERMGYK